MGIRKRQAIYGLAFGLLLSIALSCAGAIGILIGRKHQHLMDFGDAADWDLVIDRWLDLLIMSSIGVACSTLAVVALYMSALGSASEQECKVTDESKEEPR